MPKRLSELVIREGALVDKGDNPLAKITFWKRRDPDQGDTMPTPEEVQKAHAQALATKDTEIAKLQADLKAANESAATEIAKLKKGEAVAKVDPLAGLPEDIRKRLVDSDARAEALEKKLAEETDARRTAEFTKRAEQLGTVPGMTVGEVATILKALPTSDAERLEKALRATAAQAKESAALLKELGRVGQDGAGVEGPMEKLEVLAKSYAAANKVPLAVARYEVQKSGEGEKLFNEARKAEQEG
jgi:hypothetical protein